MGRFETVEADGTMSRMYAAGEFEPGAPGVVVFHPWWGLNDDDVAYADRLVASVVYYGSIAGGSLTRASVPVLGHFAETDPYESDEGLAAFEATLRSAGRDVVIHRYPGTGHWFAEPSRDAYHAGAADQAFDRTASSLACISADGRCPSVSLGALTGGLPELALVQRISSGYPACHEQGTNLRSR